MTVLGHVGRGTGDFEPFNQRFDTSRLVTPQEIKNGVDLDALVIWGGEDISPSLYNSSVNPMCGAGRVLSQRDRLEYTAMLAAANRGIPIIGVCRGAQLLCAMAGGRLVQHVTNHGRSHKVITDDGREIVTSSVHHQMMYPWDVDHELIAWSAERRSNTYEMGDDLLEGGKSAEELSAIAAAVVEPEIVWFPKVRGLAIQGHPEFMSDHCEFVQYCMELVDRFIAIREPSNHE